MTRSSKKQRERFFAEAAARFLGKSWTIGPDREHPDFLVTEDAHQFGLELCELFTGGQGRAGSAMRRSEAETQRAVDELRRAYKSIAPIPLCVKFVGGLGVKNMADVIPALIADDLPSKPIGYQFVIDEDNGLRAHVTKAFRPDWFSVNDRCGSVNRDPQPRIVSAIESKSEKIPLYIQNAGSDIRLLLVADRIRNSGKLMLERPIPIDMRGFQVVYFLSYPESVTIFDQAAHSH